jgi:hypothetical protein
VGSDGGRGYDSFVIRLWREPETGSLLRADVEHVQSGLAEVGIGRTWDWVRDWLRDHVGCERPGNQEGDPG